MKYFLMLLFAMLIGMGCTFSVNLVQSEGKANDVVDETTSNEPNLSIPAEVI